MFKRKCPKCENKIERSYEFCPNCGQNLNSPSNKEDYGFLGRNDNEEIEQDELFGGPVIDRLFKSAMKMMQNQMREISRQPRQNPQNTSFPGSNFQLFINGKKVNLPNQQQRQIPQQTQPQKISITPEKAQLFAKLPKQEAKSKVRRIGNKVIYEISLPGVKTINDILINQLETSIEIKAIAKTKVYTKILNVNLPITKYDLDDSTLILELQGK